MNRPSSLVRLLESRSRALKRHLPRAVAGDDTGVHQARVASRRLREALPVLTSGLHGSKAGKAQRKIRRLTRALGTVRELDVTLHVMDEFRTRPGIPPQALDEVRAHVIAERESRQGVMHERLASVNLEKLDRRLQTVRETVGARSPEHTWRGALATRLVTRARRLDKAIAHAGQMYSPEALHAVRIAAKKLRYALEIAGESRAAACASELRTIKRVQDTLGRLHDLQIFQHHVLDVAAAPRRRQAAADAALATIARAIEDDCRMLHGRYVALLPALREAVHAIRRDIAVRVTAQRTAAKMELATERRAAGSAI